MIVLLATIAGGTAAAVTLQLPQEYEVTTVALANPKQALLPGPDTGGAANFDQLVQTYVQLINETPVHERLIKDGVPRSAEQLSASLSARVRPNTTLIDITVRDPDPRVALLTAQDVIPAFNSALQDLQNQVHGSSPQDLQALVPWRIPSTVPSAPVGRNIPLNTGIAVLIAVALGSALAFLLEYLDRTIKTEYEVPLALGLPLLGSVLDRRNSRGERTAGTFSMITSLEPHDQASEAYRAIRTNLLFNAVGEGHKRFVVTSAVQGEGKTSTATNLAVAFAQAGKKVILVDADFRHPSLHRFFGRRQNIGLGNFILGNLPEEDLVTATSLPNLAVVCSGPLPPNPSELLGSPLMDRALKRLDEFADLVIIDTPPILAVTDAAVLAAGTQGVILVVEQGRTSIPTILRAKQKLEAIHAPILGVVLNKLRDEEQASYYNQYAEAEKSNQNTGRSLRYGGSVASAASSQAVRPEASDP
jgi:capsular exopolysaccharide synthesis family protein